MSIKTGTTRKMSSSVVHDQGTHSEFASGLTPHLPLVESYAHRYGWMLQSTLQPTIMPTTTFTARLVVQKRLFYNEQHRRTAAKVNGGA